MDNLDEYQYAVKGWIIAPQCLNLFHAISTLKSPPLERGFVFKLDIAKAFSSLPHMLLYYMMERTDGTGKTTPTSPLIALLMMHHVHQVFQDFCVETQGYVKGQLRVKSNRPVKKGAMGLRMM